MKELTRRRFLEVAAGTGLGLGLGAGCGSGNDPAPAPGAAAPTLSTDRPNIVLVILDTLRADKLGCYGFAHDTSPALDRIAEKGVLFERAVSQCSWTRPSCGSLLTSLYPRQLGLYKEQGEILHDRYATLPKVLNSAGYQTFGITANPNLNSIFNFHQGFDAYVDTNVVWGWMPKGGKQAVRSSDTHLPTAPEMFGQVKAWAQQQDTSTPKYVQVNAMEVHEWYLRKTMIRPEYQREFLQSSEKHPKYLQSVRQLTDDTAQFVEELSSMPGWENTLFVLISDHGEGLDDHEGVANSLYHGWLLYESQVVVPMIFYNKAWQGKARRVTQAVRMLELMPTLLEVAGVAGPDGMEGVSLKPLFDGIAERVALPEYFVCETSWRNAEKVGVYAPEWKYFDNQRPQKGLPRHELQEKGGGESGMLTDMAKTHPEIMGPMAEFAREWERQYPKVPASLPDRELTEDEKEQLRAIGYIPD